MLRFGMLCGCFVVVLAGCSSHTPSDPKAPVATESAETSPAEPTESTSSPAGPAESSSAVDEHIRLAEQAVTAGQWDDARAQLQKALVTQPSHANAIFLFAQVEAKSGSLQDAIETLQSIDEQDPQFGVPALGQSAQWLAELGRVDDAKAKYARALELAPQLDFLRHRYAAYLNFMGWRYEARDVLMPLVEAGNADESELRALLNVSDSFANSQATHYSEEPARESPFSESLGWLRNRQPRTALEILEAFIKAELVSRNAALDAALAAAHAELQEFDKVQKILTVATPGIEENPLYWRAIGDKLLFEGKAQDAAGAFLRSLQLDTTSQIAHERMMAVLLQVGNEAAARAVDDRRVILVRMTEAATRIGAGQPDDLAAGIELVQHLMTAAYPSLASAWLQLILDRHPTAEEALRLAEELAVFRQTPEPIIRQLQLSGLTPEQYPAPALERQLLAAGTEPDSNANDLQVVKTPACFVDVAEARGLVHTYHNAAQPRTKNFQIYQSMGAGVAAIDFDRDGLIDFYCGQAGCDPPNGQSSLSDTLFRNLGERFAVVTDQALVADYNYTACVSSGDLNQDGFPDLLIGNLGLNRALINQGDGTFREASDELGWSDPQHNHYTMGLAIADLSGDGIGDIVEINYVNSPDMFQPMPVGPDGNLISMPGPLHYPSEVDRVWINRGDGSVEPLVLGSPAEDIGTLGSAALGDAANPGLGLSVRWMGRLA
jgi:tetratricopeptide (TPR) repeat protein